MKFSGVIAIDKSNVHAEVKVKGQGHTGQKIADFDPNWAFQDCNSSLNLAMATKWCTKLEVV